MEDCTPVILKICMTAKKMVIGVTALVQVLKVANAPVKLLQTHADLNQGLCRDYQALPAFCLPIGDSVMMTNDIAKQVIPNVSPLC